VLHRAGKGGELGDEWAGRVKAVEYATKRELGETAVSVKARLERLEETRQGHDKGGNEPAGDTSGTAEGGTVSKRESWCVDVTRRTHKVVKRFKLKW